jgi:cytochrome oxidase Cu insertion factor (SCO1/SenC/PrrC family)
MLPLVFFIAWLAITMMWWGLAFAPLPATPPAWLVVAREVCFGATPNGLPEGYGWLTLYGGPGSMLGFLLVVWGRQLRDNFQTLRGMRSGRAAIVILAIIPLLGALWVGQRVVTATKVSAAFGPPSHNTPLPPHYPRLEQPAPRFSLIDQHGRVTSLSERRGDVTILTFAFAHCSTICTTTVQTARAALDETAGIAPGLWVITLDPWRDTAGALPGLASKWRLDSDKMRVLSGDVDAVLAALDAYNVPHQRNARSGDITHPPLVYIIDADGRIAYAFNNPSRSWLVEAVSRVATPKPS